MNKPQDSESSDEKKNHSADKSSIPSKPEDTDASGDALSGAGEDNHHKK